MSNATQARTLMNFSHNLTTPNYTDDDVDRNGSAGEAGTSEAGEREAEIARIIHVVSRPLIILLGTVGNLLTFYVMRRRGSLKHVSTCFYMSILALADTGQYRM